MTQSKIRNVAIIAHVDHGKTTLIDGLLRQTGIFRSNQKVVERVMDQDDLEREKGITIFSKNAAIQYEGYRINLVDTPGHADFGGEVQRILKMVDSVLLLVDALEGPMPQTKYVLRNALQMGHAPIVVINKIDRPQARPLQVLDEVFDLFVELGANDRQLDFPVVYASARDGHASLDHDGPGQDLSPLLRTIINHVPPPQGESDQPLQWFVSAVSYDPYLGRLGTGRIHRGTIKPGQDLVLMRKDGSQMPGRISRVFVYRGLEKMQVEEAGAGEIVCLAGLDDLDVGETLCAPDTLEALPPLQFDEPTLTMSFRVNDSPFAGREGRFVTARHLEDRLRKEALSNVNLRLEPGNGTSGFPVRARGALQLAILMENMRREGYEFQVSRPQVIEKVEDGVRMEPIELAMVDVAEEFAGTVIELMGQRKGELKAMSSGQTGYTRLEFSIPSRGLIGFHGEFLTATRGTGVLNHAFAGYEPWKGDLRQRNRGALIALENGVAVTYSLFNLQERGTLFMDPGEPVYAGMIVGENSRENDLVVNVCKTKKLTNMRAAGSDEALRLTPARAFTLEQALEYLADDALLEVTPQKLRMRMRYLDHNERKRQGKLEQAG